MSFVRLLEILREAWNSGVTAWNRASGEPGLWDGRYGSGPKTSLVRVENSLRYWAVAGTLFVALVVVLVVLAGVL